MFIGGMMVVLAMMQVVVSLTPNSDIKITNKDIVIADVVSPSGIDKAIYERVATKVIATLQDDKTSIDISRSALANLVRRRVPLFSDIDITDGQKTIHFESHSQSLPDSRSCKVTSGVIAKGSIVTANKLTVVPCREDTVGGHIRYDRQHGVIRARTELSARTYLGHINTPKDNFVDTGDEMVLMVAIGPVRIERPVWALQPAFKADHIFVTDKDGALLRVPVMNSYSDYVKTNKVKGVVK